MVQRFLKNKRFEIYEIPLDIVDISEKTVNKTELKKRFQKKKKTNPSLFSSISKNKT